MLIRSFGGAAARLVFAAFAICGFFATAEAQYITYVATNGNDANPCTVITAPCKTLQRAVNVTPANGAVRVLTPLQSSVFINKNIIISGDGVPIVGQITIGGAAAIVTLRGLALDGVGGYVNGIRIDSAAAVHIEDCAVERYTGDGIRLVATTATQLFISGTVARENTGSGTYVDDANAVVTVENSRFENNGAAGLYLAYASATISDSVFTDNNMGISNAGVVTITNSVIANNSTAIYNLGPLYTRQNNTLGGPVTGHTGPTPLAAY